MSESLAANNLKDLFLECPVCQEHFNHTERTPRLLTSCLHAFCTQCLEKLLRKTIGEVCCPLCRHVQKVAGGAESLPKDPVRYQLAEYLDTQKNQNYCPNHPDRLIECFCEICAKLCCLKCAFNHHKGHDIKDLKELSQTKIRNIVQKMKEVTDKLTAANCEYVFFRQSTKTAADKAISDIQEKFNRQFNLLERRRDVLIRQVKEETGKLLNTASEHCQYNRAVLESAKTYIMNATTRTDDERVVRSYPAVMETLVGITNQNEIERNILSSGVHFHDTNSKNVTDNINIYGYVFVIDVSSQMPTGTLEDETQNAASLHLTPSVNEPYSFASSFGSHIADTSIGSQSLGSLNVSTANLTTSSDGSHILPGLAGLQPGQNSSTCFGSQNASATIGSPPSSARLYSTVEPQGFNNGTSSYSGYGAQYPTSLNDLQNAGPSTAPMLYTRRTPPLTTATNILPSSRNVKRRRDDSDS